MKCVTCGKTFKPHRDKFSKKIHELTKSCLECFYEGDVPAEKWAGNGVTPDRMGFA